MRKYTLEIVLFLAALVAVIAALELPNYVGHFFKELDLFGYPAGYGPALHEYMAGSPDIQSFDSAESAREYLAKKYSSDEKIHLSCLDANGRGNGGPSFEMKVSEMSRVCRYGTIYIFKDFLAWLN